MPTFPSRLTNDECPLLEAFLRRRERMVAMSDTLATLPHERRARIAHEVAELDKIITGKAAI